MSLAPLLAAPLVVQVHAFAAMAALLLGLVQFALPKGGGHHRLLGWTWTGLMVLVALSSFGIASRGRFSWIHILSAVTLLMLPLAVGHAWRGRIASHRQSMIWLFITALVVTGGFTLLPGRIMGWVVFG
jgi:uncharacterized membrane protein